MSWIQKLYETYEANVGRPSAEGDSVPLFPVGHTVQQAHVEIVLDAAGRFKRAQVIDGVETLIPATESSAGRTSSPRAHPLCDKIQYVAGDYGTEAQGGTKTPCFALYVDELRKWHQAVPHPKTAAVLAYVECGHVVSDLIAAGVLAAGNDGKLLNVPPEGKSVPAIFGVLPKDGTKKVDGKPMQDQGGAFVRWRVEVPSLPQSGTWDDPSLIEAWTAYLATKDAVRGLCYATGASDQPLAGMHPKRIRHAGDGARLISSNDNGYTFRGRFVQGDEAAGVASEVTQKAHSALRWLIGRRQAFRNGEQVVVAWAVAGKPIPDPLADSQSLFAEELDASGTPGTMEQMLAGDAGRAFARRLAKRIAGYQASLGPADDIVVMGMDAATPGRLAITFYRELNGSTFLGRVHDWHETHAWPQNFGKELRFTGAPAPKDIAGAAYGRRLDDKIARATVERLLPCIIDGRPLPRDLVEAVVRRCRNRPGMSVGEWEKTIGIACSLYRGFHNERSYEMALEPERRTRDYLYGRLLAMAEHLESRALYIGGESRDTTAAKLMHRFSDRPYSTWSTIEKGLRPYMSRLQAKRPRFLSWMQDQLDAVHGLFPSVEEYQNDRPLSGEYLLGYHCQRSVLRQGAPGITGDDQQDSSDE